MTRRIAYALAGAVTIAAIGVTGVRAATAVTVSARHAPRHVSTRPVPALSWRTYRVGRRPFVAVRCPTTRICIAITKNGQLLSTRDAAARRPRWTVTAGLSVMGPSEDYEQTTAYNLSCPSARLCVTSDRADVLYSTDPTGPASAWRPIDLQPAGLNAEGEIDALSCPTTRLCVGALNEEVDESGGGTELRVVTSTDPTGGASAWNVSAPPTDRIDYMVDLACAPTGVCAAGDEYGSVLATARGAAGGAGLKRVVGLKSELDYVACPSARLCVGADENGHLVASTAPTSRRWTETPLGSGRVLQDISCSSVTFCAAVGAGNRQLRGSDPKARYLAAVLSSATPARARSWSYRTLPVKGARLTSISCRSSSFCVAVGEAGLVALGTG